MSNDDTSSEDDGWSTGDDGYDGYGAVLQSSRPESPATVEEDQRPAEHESRPGPVFASEGLCLSLQSEIPERKPVTPPRLEGSSFALSEGTRVLKAMYSLE